MVTDHYHEDRLYWDRQAASFDDQPDHGLRDPVVRQAWTKLLDGWGIAKSARVLDIGCGTGSLSLVLAGLGHQVTGIDLSSEMITRAKEKTANDGYQINYQVMDATKPGFPTGHFDALLCRHLLWSLPDPKSVLANWAVFLKPGAKVFLIEGYWHTGSGMHAEQILQALPSSFKQVTVKNLRSLSDLWGQPVSDERYAIKAVCSD